MLFHNKKRTTTLSFTTHAFYSIMAQRASATCRTFVGFYQTPWALIVSPLLWPFTCWIGFLRPKLDLIGKQAFKLHFNSYLDYYTHRLSLWLKVNRVSVLKSGTYVVSTIVTCIKNTLLQSHGLYNELTSSTLQLMESRTKYSPSG